MVIPEDRLRYKNNIEHIIIIIIKVTFIQISGCNMQINQIKIKPCIVCKLCDFVPVVRFKEWYFLIKAFYPWAVYCEGPPSFIWRGGGGGGGGEGEGEGQKKVRNTFIPVYIHIHIQT